jgi:phage/plasmid primase-like uncharacterized protein
MTPEDIARARDMRLEDELHHRGVKLRRAGAEMVGPCPACGGTDRFAINVRRQIWNCRQCGVGGDIIALVRHLDREGFAAAISTLAGNSVRPTAAPQSARERRDDVEDELRKLRYAESIWQANK